MYDNLKDRYFEWIYCIVYSDDAAPSYRKLLSCLHNQEFYYVHPDDINRYVDGIDFRGLFAYYSGYSNDVVEKYLNIGNCTVLEMIAALAFRVEENIMSDPDEGDRTGQWFWDMIVNLGLSGMSDDDFDEDYCIEVITNFLNRNYLPNGKGGLFYVRQPFDDMREIDIWSQCMWYLDENYDYSL